MPPVTWKQAANQFAILFGERFAAALAAPSVYFDPGVFILYGAMVTGLFVALFLYWGICFSRRE